MNIITFCTNDNHASFIGVPVPTLWHVGLLQCYHTREGQGHNNNGCFCENFTPGSWLNYTNYAFCEWISFYSINFPCTYECKWREAATFHFVRQNMHLELSVNKGLVLSSLQSHCISNYTHTHKLPPSIYTTSNIAVFTGHFPNGIILIMEVISNTNSSRQYPCSSIL